MGRKSKIAAVVLSISVLLGGCSLGKTDIVFTTGLSANEVFKIEHENMKRYLWQKPRYIFVTTRIYMEMSMESICGNSSIRPMI